jgi:hypothetical protein
VSVVDSCEISEFLFSKTCGDILYEFATIITPQEEVCYTKLVMEFYLLKSIYALILRELASV